MRITQKNNYVPYYPVQVGFELWKVVDLDRDNLYDKMFSVTKIRDVEYILDALSLTTPET